MAASEAAPAVGPTPSSPRPRSSRTVALSLALALGIVAAAWAVGGRQGFDAIGSGGVNQRLLPKVGEPAPAFQALSVEGEVIDSSEFAGVPHWINFWGSWCAPCRAELPEIKAAATELKERGLVVVVVSLDEPTMEATLYLAQNNVVDVVPLSDPDRLGTGGAYNVNNFPTHIFVDAQGIVRSVVLAPMTKAEAIANAEKAISPAG